MKKFLLFIIAISCLCLCGCGGGGDSSGNGLNPEQQEYADIVYAFQAAVNQHDIEAAKKVILAEVVYNKDKNGYKEFKDRLTDFFEKASDIKFEISDIGVKYLPEDDVADVQAESVITYTYKGEPKSINEILVFTIEKQYRSSKGIREFKKYGSDEISAFPPVLE